MNGPDFFNGGMHPFGLFPFGLIGGLGGLIFFAGFVLLAIWAFRALAGPLRPAYASPTQPAPTAMETPLEILRRRFAAGEITADEFSAARDILAGPPAAKS